ncbi:MAG: hypothetical protein Q4C53_05805 [Clostridia bacterium]|nr:hypothetical protein [Clostridia bacterium]
MMKRLIALCMAVLFSLSLFTVAMAETAAFEGVVTKTLDGGFIVTNESGSSLTFTTDKAPELGSTVKVDYEGKVGELLTAKKVTVTKKAVTNTVSGLVTSVSDNSFIVTTLDGKLVNFVSSESLPITGVAGSLTAGQAVKVSYAEVEGGVAKLNIATAVEVTVNPTAKVTKAAEQAEKTTNKKLTGTVTKMTDTRITIKTANGKKWTFKYDSKYKKTHKRGKYELKVGAKVRITYDGFASAHPFAKGIQVLNPNAASLKTHKKSGTVASFGGMNIKLTNGFEADVAGAKHVGKGKHAKGTKVTITYTTKKGRNYASRINWKTK